MVRPEVNSMPLVKLTTGPRKPVNRAAASRNALEGTATTATSASTRAASNSVSKAQSPTSGIPGRNRAFNRVRASSDTCSGRCPQSRTE